MRKAVILAGMFFLLPSFVFAYDVSYSSSTPTTSTSTAPQICPANSTLQGTMCYCNSTYKQSGNQCVKDAAMPSGTYEIYQDIAVAVSVNYDNKLSCAQLGFSSAIEVDMCKRYQATPVNQLDAWKIIPRPSANIVLITNPWAAPNQQTLNWGSSASTAIPANIPPPPPPQPTSTPEKAPETTSVPAPVPETPAPAQTTTEKPSEENNTAAAKALADLKPTKFDENYEALKKGKELEPLKDEPVATSTPPAPPPAPTTTVPTNNQFAQIAGVEAAQNGVNMSNIIAGLSLIPASPEIPKEESPAPSPMPEPQKTSLLGGFFNWIFSFL